MARIPMALTIMPTKDPSNKYKKDIDEVILWMKLRCDSLVVYLTGYEISSNGYLHMHALVYIDSNFYRKKICRKFGWSIDMKHLLTKTDVESWVDYIQKKDSCDFKRDVILMDHYLWHNYAFE